MKKIGLTVSGGGIRATIFHIGVLRWLAENNLLNKIKFISSVSGGSLCVGLVYSLSGNQWPSDEKFLKTILPAIKNLVTSTSITNHLIFRSSILPWRLLQSKTNTLSKTLERTLKITGLLHDLPDSPRWFINSTCAETGKNWRFTQKRMGDYIFGYAVNPKLKIADAIAASMSVPILVGTLKINTKKYSWMKYTAKQRTQLIKPFSDSVHLWDGGVYENLGLEPLFKNNEIARKECDSLIVSDASAPLLQQKRSLLKPFQFLYRPIEIFQDQNRSIRSRVLIDFFKKQPNSGILLRMGNTCNDIFKLACIKGFDTQNTLSEIDVKRIFLMETTLRKITLSEFSLLERHGWEVCKATVFAYGNHIKDTSMETSLNP